MANYEEVLEDEQKSLFESSPMYGGSVVTIAYTSDDALEDNLLMPPKPPMVCIDGQDIWDVKSLHFDEVSEQKSSGTLKDIAESQSRSYYEAIDDMKKEIEEIKCDAEKAFCEDSEYVIAELGNIQSSIKEKLQQLMTKEISEVNEDEFNKMEAYIKYSIQNHFKTVQNYYEDIMDNENQKNKRMKAAFKKCYATLRSIYYKEPKGLQDYFDTLIQRANQTSLCNQQSYSELYAKLMVQGKVQETSARAKLRDHRRECEAWELEKLYEKIRQAQEFGISDDDSDLDRTPDSIVASITSAEEMIQKLMSLHEESATIEDHPTETLTDGVQDVALFIDSRARQILDMYKTAVHNIHTGLHESDDEPKLETCISMQKIKSLRNDLQTSLVPQIVREGGEDATKHPWGQAVQTMEKNLEGFNDFLESCVRIWDEHFSRITDSQQRVLDELKSQIEKNELAIDEKEIKLSKVLSALRQGNTEEKLLEKLQNVADILEEIKVAHEQNCQSEAKCIAQYKEYVDPLSNSLVTDFKTILKSYPPHRKNPYVYAGKAPLSNAEVASLPRIMRLCEMQVGALENWKYGLWIAMFQYRRKCNSEIKQMACNWIESEINKAQKKLEAKLFVHNKRYNNIVSEIYNIRLVELRLHSQRFKEHKQGVIKVLDDLNTQMNELVNKLNEELLNLKTFLEETGEAAKQLKKSGFAYSKVKQLETLSNTYCSKINKAMEAFQAECENKLISLQDSNVKYMESIKFFSEDGNFTVEEAKMYTVELGEVKKLINKSIKETEKEAIKKENVLILSGKQQIQLKIDIMKKIGDELQFSEKSMEVLETAKIKIKREVFELKFKTHILNSSAAQLLSSITYCNVKHEPLSELCEKWQSLIKDILRARDYLLQPSSQVTDNTGTVTCSMPLKFNSNIDASGGKLTAASIKFKNKTFKDYRALLFGTAALPIDNSFMSNICATLLQALSQLQQLSCEFYAIRATNTILKPDVTPPRHDVFTNEMLIKLKYYHVQCENVWMMHVQDYLNMITRLKRAVNDYGPACIEDAHSKNMNALTKIAQKCTSTLEEVTEKHFENLRKNFKLLLGYPRNEEILEDLDESALASCSALKTGVSDITSKYKTKMLSKSESLSSDLLSLQNSVHSIIEDVFSPAMTEIMMLQITTVEQSIRPSESKTTTAQISEGTQDSEKTATTSKSGKVKNEQLAEKGNKGKKGKGADKEDTSHDANLVDIDRRMIPEEDTIEFSTKALCKELSELTRLPATSRGLSFNLCAKSKFRPLDLSCRYKTVALQSCLDSIEDQQVGSLIQEYKDVVESFERSATMQAACYMKTTEEWLRVWKLNMTQAKEYDIN